MSEKYLYERELTEDWFEKVNEELRKKDIPHRQRPWEAMMEWANYSGDVFSFNDEIGKRIFTWFEKNTKAGSQQFGSMYVGSFYYDSCFWPVFIPVVAGTFKLDAAKSLRTMPDTIKSRLTKDVDEFMQYLALWCDCYDYGYGIEGLMENKSISTFGQELFSSGNQQLTATVTLLHEDIPNPKAMESARMATELFLKAFLAVKVGLTEKFAKDKIGHNLEKALNMCVEVDDNPELHFIQPDLTCFPKIADRYKGTEKTPREIWQGYDIAQFAGATIVRSLTGCDSRNTVRVS
jgi:hypothetical protein